jgi:hypothetical protein
MQRKARWPWRAAALALLGGLARHPAPLKAQGVADVDAAARRGIETGLYPGAVVVIGRRDTILYARGYGHLTWSSASPVPFHRARSPR